jgi:DNA replication protein DnaC
VDGIKELEHIIRTLWDRGVKITINTDGPYLLDRLMHHAHMLKFEGKSWRLKEAAARVAKRSDSV